MNPVDESTNNQFPDVNEPIARRNFAICNVSLVLLFVAGNTFIPAIFWRVLADDPLMLLSVFVSGALGMQIAMFALLGGFYDQFILERLTWSILGVTACTLFISLGLQLAEPSFSRGSLDVELTLLLSGIGFGCFAAILAVSLVLRRFLHYRFAYGGESEIASNKSFGIAFLLKLTAAIACLMIGIKMLSTKLAFSSGIPITAFSVVALLSFVLVCGLIAGALKLALANDRRILGLWTIALLLLVGSPILVCVCRMVVPNSWSFGWQLSAFFTFLSGFTGSLLGVLYLWRKTGLRMVGR